MEYESHTSLLRLLQAVDCGWTYTQRTHTITCTHLICKYVCVYGRKKVFEGYKSCAHFRGALSIPHQYWYQTDNNKPKQAAITIVNDNNKNNGTSKRVIPTITATTTTKCCMCYAFNRIHNVSLSLFHISSSGISIRLLILAPTSNGT